MSLQDTIAIRPVAETLRRAQAGKSYWTRVRERLLADPVTVTVVALLLCIIVMVLAAPLIATHDPSAASVFARLKSPGYPGHWLGTDEVGRDLWSRILYGGRLAPLCGGPPAAPAVVIRGRPRRLSGHPGRGVPPGILLGRGGIVNSCIMRGMDVLYAFPPILLATAICGMLGSGVGNTVLALTVTFIPPIVRISETMTTQVRSFEFVEAARASGAGPLSIMR